MIHFEFSPLYTRFREHATASVYTFAAPPANQSSHLELAVHVRSADPSIAEVVDDTTVRSGRAGTTTLYGDALWKTRTLTNSLEVTVEPQLPSDSTAFAGIWEPVAQSTKFDNFIEASSVQHRADGKWEVRLKRVLGPGNPSVRVDVMVLHEILNCVLPGWKDLSLAEFKGEDTHPVEVYSYTIGATDPWRRVAPPSREAFTEWVAGACAYVNKRGR